MEVCPQHLRVAPGARAEWTQGNTTGGNSEQLPGAKSSRLCRGPGTSESPKAWTGAGAVPGCGRHHVGLAMRAGDGGRGKEVPGVPEARVEADPADGQVGAHAQPFSPP